MINSEIASQLSKKLDEIKAYLNSQILQAINWAIREEVLPDIHSSQGVVKWVALEEKWTFGLHRNLDAEISHKTQVKLFKNEFKS